MRLRILLLSVAISIPIQADRTMAEFGPSCAHPTRLPDPGPWTVPDIVGAFGQPSKITEAQVSRHFYERDGCTFVATIENGDILKLDAEPERSCIHAFPAQHQPARWYGSSVQDLVKTFGRPDSQAENIRITRLHYFRTGCNAMATAESGIVTSIVSLSGFQGCHCPEAK
jgi:hypothetical protein